MRRYVQWTLALLVTAVGFLAVAPEKADAQVYYSAPAVVRYRPFWGRYQVYYPPVVAAPVVAAPPVMAAPMPVTSYYAPTTSYYAPTTTYYAPAPVTTYYAPAPTVRYYAPRATYYAPYAPVLVP